MSRQLIQGWGAPPMGEQFPELQPDAAEQLESLNAAITNLYMAGLLTNSVYNDLRTKKFPKFVSTVLSLNKQPTSHGAEDQ